MKSQCNFTEEELEAMTYPTRMGDLKKGDYVMIKDGVCKLLEVSIVKNGKHGHSKTTLTGKNMFTSKKAETAAPSSHMIDCPVVERKEYLLADILDDNFLKLQAEKGAFKENLQLTEKEEDEELNEKIRKDFAKGKNVLVCVISSLGKEKIISCREKQH
jgi:translation initiation factor 5A